MPEGTGIRTAFDQAAALAGLKLQIALEASAPNAVADLAARGLGVAILSETIAAAHADRLRSAVIADVGIPAELALIWKPSPTPAARAFLTHCRHAFPPAPPPSPLTPLPPSPPRPPSTHCPHSHPPLPAPVRATACLAQGPGHLGSQTLSLMSVLS